MRVLVVALTTVSKLENCALCPVACLAVNIPTYRYQVVHTCAHKQKCKSGGPCLDMRGSIVALIRELSDFQTLLMRATGPRLSLDGADLAGTGVRWHGIAFQYS